jgi:hypothetical protein
MPPMLGYGSAKLSRSFGRGGALTSLRASLARDAFRVPNQNVLKSRRYHTAENDGLRHDSESAMPQNWPLAAFGSFGPSP